MIVDVDTLNQLAINASWLLPIVTALVQVVKKATPKLDNMYTPIIAIVIGIGAGLLLIELSVTGAVIGLILGLSGTGLYENINLIGKSYGQ